ncbi:MAG: cytochrome b/b6 domain-containing protein [Candidatus Odinarchaeota archaeon]
MHEAEASAKQETTVPKSGIITVERYSLIHRLHHWVHALTMALFCLTGFEIYLGVFFIPGFKYFPTRTLHFALGIFAIFWDLIFYLSILIIDRKISEIIVTPRDVKNMVTITLCALKIFPDEKYPDFNLYNVTKGKYVMKYHPVQKLLALADLFMIIIIGISGLALAEEMAPGTAWILGPIALALMVPFTLLSDISVAIIGLELNIRFIHFGVFVYFAATSIAHTYFALLPQNIQSFKGMVIGTEQVDLSATLDRIEH